jgi:hypothetical protein
LKPVGNHRHGESPLLQASSGGQATDAGTNNKGSRAGRRTKVGGSQWVYHETNDGKIVQRVKLTRKSSHLEVKIDFGKMRVEVLSLGGGGKSEVRTQWLLFHVQSLASYSAH